MSGKEAIDRTRTWVGLEGRDLVTTIRTDHSFSWEQRGYDLDTGRFRNLLNQKT